jgi:AbrB family looped-hinge helix DNA binding protein
MTERTFFKSRLRDKGQITVPSEIRSILGAREGEDLLFHTDEQGRVIVTRAQVIPPDQAWFWTERWQRLERQAQADIEQGRVDEFASVDEALAFLTELPVEPDAED